MTDGETELPGCPEPEIRLAETFRGSRSIGRYGRKTLELPNRRSLNTFEARNPSA